MAEFDKKIATEAEFYEIIKPFDDVPSELSNGICLRKDKIPKYTEKTFDRLNSYTNNQLVPLNTIVDVGNADYVLFSFEWKEDGDLDCIVKPKNFNEEYPGIGFGTPKTELSYGISYDSNNELRKLIQWSGDSIEPGGEYFLINLKELKEYKIKHNLAINYFDFDVYTLWYRTNNVEQTVTMKIESIIADDVQRVEKSPFTFTNKKVTKTFSYEFSTNVIRNSSGSTNGDYFFYDLVKRIRCYGSFAVILDINFPKIKSVTSKNEPPKIIVNGVDNSPIYVGDIYNIKNIKSGDKIKITLYPYGFEKIVTYSDGHDQTLFEYLKIRDIGNINKPTSDILTCTYNIANDGSEMTIDINTNNISEEQVISFNFLGSLTRIYLQPTNPI